MYKSGWPKIQTNALEGSNKTRRRALQHNSECRGACLGIQIQYGHDLYMLSSASSRLENRAVKIIIILQYFLLDYKSKRLMRLCTMCDKCVTPNKKYNTEKKTLPIQT